jgi:hypothetical protein
MITSAIPRLHGLAGCLQESSVQISCLSRIPRPDVNRRSTNLVALLYMHGFFRMRVEVNPLNCSEGDAYFDQVKNGTCSSLTESCLINSAQTQRAPGLHLL